MVKSKEANNSKINVNSLLRRLLVYVAGLFVLAVGVGVAVKSNLGISPVNSIPYVLSQVTGLDQGLLTTLVFCGFIVIQIILLRRDFKIIQLLQVACATVFGYFVTLCNNLLAFPAPQSYPLKLVLTIISVICVAGGMFLYLCGELIPQPAEGLCLAVEKKSGWKYSNIKVGFDCTLVFTAAVISLVAAGSVVGLREGTLIAMLSVGKIIGFMSARWKKGLMKFCAGE